MLRPRVHITYDVLRTLHADVPTFSAHHSLLITHYSKAQRHEFRPSVVAMAERILITVWMISFQVSLFFIIIVDYGPPLNTLRRAGDCAPLTATQIDI